MIDTLKLSDSAAAASLSAGFGWPHRVEDWAWFLQAGQGVAWRAGGTLSGTAMMFPLDARHGTIGLVQVSPALQGQGIGRRLMEAALALSSGRHLKLHATPAGAGLYAKLGFEPREIVEQWQGVVGPGRGEPRIAGPDDLRAICALDLAVTGLDRGPLLRSLFDAGPTALAGLPGALSGYAMRRQFGRGALVGPIVAPTPHAAAALVANLQQPGFLRLDVPAGSGVIAALGAIGLASVEDVQVMVRGDWPPSPRLFGLSSQAMG